MSHQRTHRDSQTNKTEDTSRECKDAEATADAVRMSNSTARRLWRRQVIISVCFTVVWVILAASRQIFTNESHYRPRETCLDVIATVLSLQCFIGISSQTSLKADSGFYLSVLTLIATIAKLWVYRGWKLQEFVATSCMIVGCIMTSVAHALTYWQLSHVDDLLEDIRSLREGAPRKPTMLRWSTCKHILRPYFLPDGTRNKVFVILTWVVLVGGKVCGIFSPMVLGTLVSNLTHTPNPIFSVGGITLYCGLSLAPSVLREVQDNLYVKVWQTAYAQVAELTFRHVHGLSFEWHIKKRMGNVVRSMDRGMNGANNLMYFSMIYLFPTIGTAIAAFVVFAVHFDQAEIAAVCFLAFGLYSWVTFVVTMWRRKFREAMNRHDNAMHDKASDSIVNFEIVKCFTNEEHEVKRYVESVKAYQRGSFNTQASTSVLNISQKTTIQVAMFGAMAIASYCAVHNKDGFDAGEFVAIQSYVFTIFSPLSYLGMVYNMIINSMVDIQNLSDLLAEIPDVVDVPHAVDLKEDLLVSNVDYHRGVDVVFDGVSFRYPAAGPEQKGLQSVSFTIAAGTTTAVVGPTGSGKTTLSRLLFRFYDPQQGCVRIAGRDIRQCTQKSVRGLIGVVPQDTVLFNDTIGYNIRYGNLAATSDEVQAAARAAQVHDFIMKTEGGYDSKCGERGLKLSGGEKQRVAIARCLLRNPPVVLLDEATSSLDANTEKEVQDALSCLDGGRTTLVIAHRLSTIVRADQIVVLKDGVVVERGTHPELVSLRNGVYAQMWSAQQLEVSEDFVI